MTDGIRHGCGCVPPLRSRNCLIHILISERLCSLATFRTRLRVNFKNIALPNNPDRLNYQQHATITRYIGDHSYTFRARRFTRNDHRIRFTTKKLCDRSRPSMHLRLRTRPAAFAILAFIRMSTAERWRVLCDEAVCQPSSRRHLVLWRGAPVERQGAVRVECEDRWYDD